VTEGGGSGHKQDRQNKIGSHEFMP
jgi:hypothetical protein